MRYCANCGSELEDNAVFCANCGANASENEATNETNNTYTEETANTAVENAKVLGGSMEKKLFFGLVWLFSILPFPVVGWLAVIFDIIVLCADKDKLTKEEKRFSLSLLMIPVVAILAIIVYLIIALPLLILYAIPIMWLIVIPIELLLALVMLALAGSIIVFSIIATVKAFQGKTYKVPLAYQITTWFIK